MLLAVNTSGTIKSVEQGITNEKIPFARTPKVEGRTAAPWPFALAPYVIITYSFYVFVLYVIAQNWGNAAFAAFNGVLCTVGLVSFIGVRNSLQDIFLGLQSWFYVPDKRATLAMADNGQKGAPEARHTHRPPGLEGCAVLWADRPGHGGGADGAGPLEAGLCPPRPGAPRPGSPSG